MTSLWNFGPVHSMTPLFLPRTCSDVTHLSHTSKMAGFRERDKHYFPLKSVEDVVDLFKGQIEDEEQPDLTLLSIVIGAVEACLTVNRTVGRAGNEDRNCAVSFPAIQLHTIEALYQRFVVHVKGSVDLTQYDGKYATRQLVKKVSDVVWNSLARSYHKDKAHLQSIYSFLTGNKLDCFGVALATVAACQQLNYDDVHLALSEDHAWAIYGENSDETAEVTWHGKGLEDKRGLPIHQGVEEKSWLYLNGNPVTCTRHMEVAAIVSAINPAINSSMDSVEMASLQQKLLWILYDNGHLDKYPQALGSLGDLEDGKSTGRETPLDLYRKAIETNCTYYKNTHVYPYTYLGSYYYRKERYREAIYNWAQAATAISQYNHNREDEEIYKEFLEIANESIPNIVKSAGEELHRAHLIPPENTPLLQDPQCYSQLLQFYDGICQWEEGSPTPVLHVGWAQHLVHSLSKFEEDARLRINVERDGDEEEDADEDEEEEQQSRKLRRDSVTERPTSRRDSIQGKDRAHKRSSTEEQDSDIKVKRGRGRPPKKYSVGKNNNNVKENGNELDEPIETATNGMNGINHTEVPSPTIITDSPVGENVDEQQNSHEEQIKSAIEELVSRVGVEVPEAPNPNLAALAHACGESILNPQFLINGGEPFAMTTAESETLFKDAVQTESDSPLEEILENKSNKGKTGESYLETDNICSGHKDLSPDVPEEAQIVPNLPAHPESLPQEDHQSVKSPIVSEESNTTDLTIQPRSTAIHLSLHSAKMKGLKEILVAKKLNANAIKLQLTAQSQVYLKHSISGGPYNTGLVTRKRLRRD